MTFQTDFEVSSKNLKKIFANLENENILNIPILQRINLARFFIRGIQLEEMLIDFLIFLHGVLT